MLEFLQTGKALSVLAAIGMIGFVSRSGLGASQFVSCNLLFTFCFLHSAFHILLFAPCQIPPASWLYYIRRKSLCEDEKGENRSSNSALIRFLIGINNAYHAKFLVVKNSVCESYL